MILTVNDIKEFEIDLTGTCNLKCPLCTRNYEHANHMKNKNIRPIQDIIDQLNYFPNLNRIMLAGAVSEPSLYPQIFELIEYFNSRNIHIDMFTNGSTHNIEFWNRLGVLFANSYHKSTCTFTVCGSTQELHEKYRIGSSLEKLLDNATSFRTSSLNRDVLQLIEFAYNSEDLKSDCNHIKEQFTNSYIVQSEGQRRLNNYNIEFNKDIAPVEKRNKAIASIFKRRKKPGEEATIQCKAYMLGKLHINQFGQMHYCYISSEFPESKDNFVLNDPKMLNKDTTFDFTDIFKFTHPDCFLCEKNTKMLIEKSGLDFVC